LKNVDSPKETSAGEGNAGLENGTAALKIYGQQGYCKTRKRCRLAAQTVGKLINK